MSANKKCSNCFGLGKIYGKKCEKCHGSGLAAPNKVKKKVTKSKSSISKGYDQYGDKLVKQGKKYSIFKNRNDGLYKVYTNRTFKLMSEPFSIEEAMADWRRLEFEYLQDVLYEDKQSRKMGRSIPSWLRKNYA